MRAWIVTTSALIISALLLGGAYWWSKPDAVAIDTVPVDAADMQGRAGMGMAGGFGRFAAGGGMMTPAGNKFAESIALIGEASLASSFDLTNEQRAKIQAIRAEVNAARDAWQKAHAGDFKTLSEQSKADRDSGQREQLREIMQKRQELLATAPKTDEAAAKLRAILTPGQIKALDAYAAEKRKSDEELRQQTGDLFGGGRSFGGGGRGGFGGGPGGPGGGRSGAGNPRGGFGPGDRPNGGGGARGQN